MLPPRQLALLRPRPSPCTASTRRNASRSSVSTTLWSQPRKKPERMSPAASTHSLLSSRKKPSKSASNTSAITWITLSNSPTARSNSKPKRKHRRDEYLQRLRSLLAASEPVLPLCLQRTLCEKADRNRLKRASPGLGYPAPLHMLCASGNAGFG